CRLRLGRSCSGSGFLLLQLFFFLSLPDKISAGARHYHEQAEDDSDDLQRHAALGFEIHVATGAPAQTADAGSALGGALIDVDNFHTVEIHALDDFQIELFASQVAKIARLLLEVFSFLHAPIESA